MYKNITLKNISTIEKSVFDDKDEYIMSDDEYENTECLEDGQGSEKGYERDNCLEDDERSEHDYRKDLEDDADHAHDTYSDHKPHVSQEVHMDHAGLPTVVTQGVIRKGRSIDCQQHEPYTASSVFTVPVSPGQVNVKAPSKLCTLAGKAREHLRDEDNRKRALRTFQTGVRAVRTFVTEVQMKQRTRTGPRDVGKKVDGKKLAKICVKVAMKRLVK
jgi:hypothetical protein